MAARVFHAGLLHHFGARRASFEVALFSGVYLMVVIKEAPSACWFE
jgi:hypothetical protein